MRRSRVGIDRPGPINERLQGWLVWARRVGILSMVVIAGLIVRWYDFESLADAQWPALEGKVRQGAFLIFKKVDEDTLLGDGSLVEAHVVVPPVLSKRIGRNDGVILTTIAGVPGDVIHLEPLADGRVELHVNGEPTGANMWLSWQDGVAPQIRINGGPIPQGLVLLLNPAVDAEAIDSRKVGLVPRAALLRKASYL